MNEQKRGTPRARKVAIIGAGTAGRAFAFRCAQTGLDVILEDVMPEKLRRAQDEYAEQADGVLGSLRYASAVEEAVADADLAIDFVPDELESKLEIFSLIDRMAPPRTVFCTPTDVLSITDLASCTYRADRCVAVRWRNEAAVELIESRFLNEYAKTLSTELFTRLGYHTSVVADVCEPLLLRHQH